MSRNTARWMTLTAAAWRAGRRRNLWTTASDSARGCRHSRPLPLLLEADRVVGPADGLHLFEETSSVGSLNRWDQCLRWLATRPGIRLRSPTLAAAGLN